MFILPDWTMSNIIIYSAIGLFALLMGPFDYYQWVPLRYSKFGTQEGISSRWGMTILYGLPIITAFLTARSYLPNASIMQWIVFGAVVFHFSKRVLEALFVHKYSSKMSVFAMLGVAAFYSFVAGMIAWLNAETIPQMDFLFNLGMIFFLIGIMGNAYHHRLLADLRKDKDGYFIPQGGWFEYATCPHYFFELLGWLGIFLLSRHFFTLLALIGMIGYLSGRSIKTRQWYRENFDDYPAERKYMIPFIF